MTGRQTSGVVDQLELHSKTLSQWFEGHWRCLSHLWPVIRNFYIYFFLQLMRWTLLVLEPDKAEFGLWIPYVKQKDVSITQLFADAMKGFNVSCPHYALLHTWCLITCRSHREVDCPCGICEDPRSQTSWVNAEAQTKTQWSRLHCSHDSIVHTVLQLPSGS